MNINFYEAFSRHDADAALLLKKRRWANADHLLGLAAECALKAILLQQGIQSKNGDMDRPYRDHINLLWDRYQNFMQTRNVFVIPDENPFRDWNIAQRYAPKGAITKQTAKKHGAAVGKIRAIMKQAKLEGEIP